MKVTNVFERNYNSKAKIKVNQGGTRSSKTYSICQLLFVKAMAESIVIQVMRKTMPALKGTVMRDFEEIVFNSDYAGLIQINKTEHLYTFPTGATVQFISLDQPQKKRGAKRDLLYLNEANEFTKEDWIQLIVRTEGEIYLDFNPSDEFHWIYDDVLTRADCELIKSTYKDNPFLSNDLVNEIERLKETDPNYWRVYGLGERGISEAIIYSNWGIFKEHPKYDDVIYGLDFGYNNPTCLIQIGIKDNQTYWTELIYDSLLTNSDLIKKLESLGVDKKAEIYADAAEPQRIEEIHRLGYNIKPSIKSVKDGIDAVKSQKIFIHYESFNTQKEIKSYKWKQDKDGRILDEPIKFNDHAMDAARYPIYNYFKQIKPTTKFTFIRR